MSVVEIVEHPLIQHKISLMRGRRTGTKEFRDLVREVATLRCYAGTRALPPGEGEGAAPRLEWNRMPSTPCMARRSASAAAEKYRYFDHIILKISFFSRAMIRFSSREM